MDLLTVILLAIALCFDSFAISVSSGMGCCVWQRGRGVRFSLILGLMQGLMLFAGWILAHNFHSIIERWDHWIAFGLLVLLGGKMIISSLRSSGSDSEPAGDNLGVIKSVFLGFATSIDAVIVGVTMAFLTITINESVGQMSNMLLSSGIILIVTFMASLIGLYLGRRVRGGVGERAELIGGIVLIVIGVKVLFEHLC